MLCKKIMLYGKRLFFATVLLTTASRAEAQEVALFDFGNFNEDNWIQVRDPAVKGIGRFVQNDGYIQNFVKPEHIDKHALEAGHALRLLKDNTFKNGRIETELMLVGKAAPSIYFRTQVEKVIEVPADVTDMSAQLRIQGVYPGKFIDAKDMTIELEK